MSIWAPLIPTLFMRRTTSAAQLLEVIMAGIFGFFAAANWDWVWPGAGTGLLVDMAEGEADEEGVARSGKCSVRYSWETADFDGGAVTAAFSLPGVDCHCCAVSFLTSIVRLATVSLSFAIERQAHRFSASVHRSASAAMPAARLEILRRRQWSSSSLAAVQSLHERHPLLRHTPW